MARIQSKATDLEKKTRKEKHSYPILAPRKHHFSSQREKCATGSRHMKEIKISRPL